MLSSPRISIVVSCHKEFYCPPAGVYVPVHVGAARAREPLRNAAPDTQGDSISDRNFTFCELTGQYWAWKNLDADYIGQCHYRRYFCFDGLRHVANDHAQIETGLLDAAGARAFALDDDERIRSKIIGYDAVVPKSWDVRFTRTPQGVKRTVREHMIGYGLVAAESFERLEELVARMAPEYAPYVTRYLDGHEYLGYNCFVMKRSLFERLCSFEFPVLLEFDRTFSYEGLSNTQKRVCGYLGEVLFSAFVLRLKDEGTWKIAHVPLVFFEYTDAETFSRVRVNEATSTLSFKDRIFPKGSWRRVFVGKVLNRLSCR